MTFSFRHARWSVQGRALCLLALLLFAACTTGQRLQILTYVLRTSLEAFQEQKPRTLTALVAASAARAEATEQVEFSFSSPQTQLFITKWETAAEESAALREEFNDVAKAAQALFSHLAGRAQAIQDVNIREKTLILVVTKKTHFAETVQRTDQALRSLETAIQLGNDVIEAIRIAGALSGMEEKFVQLDVLQQQTLDKMPEIDTLITEGMTLLDLEIASTPT